MSEPEFPEIERMEAVALQPGDTLLVTLRSDTVSAESMFHLRESIRAKFPDQEVVVLAGVDLDVLRPEEPC